MLIYAISDVHGKHETLTVPECDILISVGDYSFRGTKIETFSFHNWLNKQPAKYIISIMGNHEVGVEQNFDEHKAIAEKECPRVHFIEEGLIEIEGLKIWCSAYTPYFCNWAYNVLLREDLKRHWDRIPEGIDILATHGPPYGMLDECPDKNSFTEKVGDRELWDAVLRIKPKAHIFGHIHESYGQKEFNGIKFYNVVNCDGRYIIARQPTEIIL